MFSYFVLHILFVIALGIHLIRYLSSSSSSYRSYGYSSCDYERLERKRLMKGAELTMVPRMTKERLLELSPVTGMMVLASNTDGEFVFDADADTESVFIYEAGESVKVGGE